MNQTWLQLRSFILIITVGLALVSVNPAIGFEPPNDGAPGRRQDSGSRPGCPQPNGQLTALIPTTNLGKTLAERPTFWLYVPYSEGEVELILEDENTGNSVYNTTFSVSQGPGIIHYRLTNDAPPLEVNKRYRWRFFFFCNPDNKADVLSVNGIIIRESLTDDLNRQLQAASPKERIDLYAARGLWYDTLTEIAQSYQANSQDTELAQKWANLLNHPIVQLEQFLSTPLVPCCSLDK